MRIFLSVAEDSADRCAAALVETARRLGEPWRFSGLTGPRLREQGVETVFDLARHAAMLTGIAGTWRRGAAALRAIESSWQAERPDLVIVLDSWVLNQHVARAARRRGIPVLYYIAPQVWASRPWRARELARVADRVACILPFEEAYLRARGIRAEFVGHPLFETAAPVTMECGTKAATGASTDLSTNSVQSSEAPRIAILPGSRRQVIEALLPRQLAVVELLRQGGLPATAQISCVSEDRLARMRALCADAAVPAEIVVGDPAAVVRGADLVLVASGTATLDVARHLKPMLVLYDAGRLLAGPYRWFGRYFLTTPHLSLVNILAGKRVVPEFMPFISEIEPIAEVARQLLRDEAWRRLMCRQLAETIRPLSDSRASLRVCEVIRSMLAA